MLEKKCGNMNGLECWRLLVQKVEPSVGSAQAAQLTSILRTTFAGDLNTFEEELERFDGAVKRDTKLRMWKLFQAQ